MWDCAPLSHESPIQARNPLLLWRIASSIVSTPSRSPRLFPEPQSLPRIRRRGRRNGLAPVLRRPRSIPRDSVEDSSDQDSRTYKSLEEAMNLKSSSSDGVELKSGIDKDGSGAASSEEDVIGIAGSGSGELSGVVDRPRGGRRVLKRSSLVAKQVISVVSGRSLGFVSQLWVDTTSWAVVLVEVRPTLLSGDFEKFLLDDVWQVGDVVLVEDESVMENELKMVGLDTLVGYNVVTSRQLNVGKVRGYTFDINSGGVESLELDSFGISFVPSSLVSTYCLFVEDIVEVVSDTVVVDEDAISRVQRVTKGLWDAQSVKSARYEVEEYSDLGRRRGQSAHGGRSQKKINIKKLRQQMRDIEDDWELPMDY